MTTHNSFTPEQMALYKEVTALTMKVARPLVWHDFEEPYPKRLLGGTCFIIRFRAGLVGVTAAHVIRAFKDTKKQNAKTECLLATMPFDIVAAIIAQDDELDIATFRVTEEQRIGSGAEAIDCTLEWPPPLPVKDAAISFAGCPEEIQTPFSHSKREFHFYVDLSFVDALTDQNIVKIHDPERDIRLKAAPELPNLGANFSGCSGGPVLMHVERNGLHRWFPVGLIVQGPRYSDETARRGWETFLFRRIHFVKEDGSIENPKFNGGWLPR
jgi:hypothetical protein